jgi:hypothetical protein
MEMCRRINGSKTNRMSFDALMCGFCTVKGVLPKWVSRCEEGKQIMSRLLRESVVAKDQHNIMI